MTRYLGTFAAIGWTDTSDTASERVHPLAVPLRAIRPAFAQSVYRGESLDRTVIESFSVSPGSHEFVGDVRFDDAPQSALDLLRAGNANQTLTYYPDVRDPSQSYACKLVSPTGAALEVAIEQARATFGNVTIPIRLRKTDQSSFQELYHGTNVLWWLRGGASLERYTFTRATAAATIGKGRGQYSAVSSGKAQVEWFDTDSDGLRETPGLRIAPARTNLCLQSENFGTTWTASGTPTRSAAALTVGTVSLDLIGDDTAGAAEGYVQTVTLTGSAAKAVSIFVAPGTSQAASGSEIHLFDNTASAYRLRAGLTWASGVPSLTMTTGTYLGAIKLDNGVYRLLFQSTAVTAANTNRVQVFPASTSGEQGDLYAGGVQVEDALAPGPYIATTTVTVTRNADLLSLPFNALPQAMSVYVRFVELGNIYETGTNNRVLEIEGTSTNPRFLIAWNTAHYGVQWFNAAGSTVSAAAATNPVIGDVVELLAVLQSDGSVYLTQAINGGAATTTATSSTLALGPSWGTTPKLYVGSENGSATGTMGFLNGAMLRGVQSLGTMRRVANL